jgi:hypothetical protein
MGWLVFIAVLVAIVYAIRSPQGVRVLGRVWLVLSVLWIAVFYLSVARHIGEPGHMDFAAATEWALIPPAVVLVLFFVLKWIVQGAERRPED